MAVRKRSTSEVVRLTHTNGAPVTVSAEKAERLVASGAFAEVKATPAKSDSK